MRFWGLFCWLLLSPVLGVCLPQPQRCHQQPLLLARLRCPLQVRRLLLVQPLRPLCPVNVSVLRSLPAQRSAMGDQLVGRGPVRVGSVAGVGPLPPAHSACSANVSASSSSESSDSEGKASAMPPPPSSRPGAGGGHSGNDRSASGRARSPQPGPSGLGSSMQAAPRADRSHSELGSRSLPAPSGAAEEDRDSVSGSVNLDRDDSFRSVLHLNWEFHSIEESASVAPNQCKTSITPIYGLQSESSPALHLPLSPLLSSLLEDTNLASAKYVEDQTVHGFLPVPSRCHRRY